MTSNSFTYNDHYKLFYYQVNFFLPLQTRHENPKKKAQVELPKPILVYSKFSTFSLHPRALNSEPVKNG